MLYSLIGLIVGMIMGLTGAGGAMISIPLFINLLNTSLKEATILSLVAVVLGTSINLIGQFSKADKKILIAFAVGGIVTNYMSLFLKAYTPDWLIAALLSLIGLYSGWSVWKKNQEESSPFIQSKFIPKALFAGSMVGILTSLTGLGGGVILVPILINFFGIKYENALPTSLGTILLISLTSFIFQSKLAFELINEKQLLLIAMGTLVSFFILKIGAKKFDPNKMLVVRKVVFTAVTLYSMVSVILKTV
jgi:uncharacterized protein